MSITSNYKKLLNNFFLIVPIMDEKVNVSLLAYNVNILYEGVEIIFIYENENDNSIPEIENLKKSFKIQSHKTDKSGISGSIKTGLKYVNESGIVGIGLADDLGKDIEEETWAFNLLFISNAKKNNYEIIEVPLISIDRIKFGNSTFNLLSWIMKYLKTLTKSIKNLYFTKK